MPLNKFSVLIFPAILIGVVLFFWSFTINIPYWWDSAGYIIGTAKYYLDTQFSSFFIPSDSRFSCFAHFPLFPWLLARFWQIFGESLWASHLFYLPFIILAVLATYFLGKKMSHFDELTNNLVGFSTALVLLFTPAFLAQVGIIYTEIPMTAFALMTVYFFLTKRKGWYLLSASLMLLMKETAISIILAILATITIDFLVKFFRKEKPNSQNFIKELFLYASPILLLLFWFWWHKQKTGWMFVLPSHQAKFEKEVFDFGAIFLNKLLFVFTLFFLNHGRFLISVSILFFILLFPKLIAKPLLSKKTLLFLLIIFFIPLFLAKIEFLPRFIVFGLPFFYLLFFYFLAFFLGEISIKGKAIRGNLNFTLTFLFFLEYFSTNNNLGVSSS